MELARLREQPIAKIAEGLGISESCLPNWMVEADVNDGRREGLTTDERAELVRLRREKRVLELEVEILGVTRFTDSRRHGGEPGHCLQVQQPQIADAALERSRVLRRLSRLGAREAFV